MALQNHLKFSRAMNSLKLDVEYSYRDDPPVTEELFNQIDWHVGVNENQTAKTTKDNPHSELTWEKVSAEMDKIVAEYDAQDYARKRKEEYPSIESLVVALYDSDDKTAIDEKRAEIKLKYPNPGA